MNLYFRRLLTCWEANANQGTGRCELLLRLVSLFESWLSVGITPRQGWMTAHAAGQQLKRVGDSSECQSAQYAKSGKDVMGDSWST